MSITVILFWLSLTVLFFCYIGYGLLLFLLNSLKKDSRSKGHVVNNKNLPSVTLIVPSFNEEGILSKKINNTLGIDYPDGKLKIIIITDGSTDRSEQIVAEYPAIKLLHQPRRQGKLAAIKRAMQHVETPVVVFSDANAMLNPDCILKIVENYSDTSIGGVAGEKKIINDRHASAIGEAEGIYWNYESFMKKQDSRFNTVVGAAGELYSIRTDLFPQLDDNIILDDFIISMKVCLQGYKVRYEPEAFATERPSASLEEERKRKTRIAAGAYQSISYLRGVLNIFKYPRLCFQYLWRRLFRWILCPYLLLVLFITNIFIVADNSHTVFIVSLTGQFLFYLLAFIGWIVIRRGKRNTMLTIPFYFVFMNYCLITGLIKFLKRKQSVLWEKSRRQAGE